MFDYRSLRFIGSLVTLSLSFGLAGCSGPDEVDEEANASSGEELTGAGIVPQVSIRGITLGMSPRQVKAKLGKPDKAYVSKGTFTVWLEYGLTHIEFDHDERVGLILTKSPGVRTNESVGVGSLRLNVDALPGTTCVSSKSYLPEGEFEGWYDHSCTIASSTAKTIFIFPDNMEASIGANAKVRSVALLEVPCEPRICKLLID